MNFPCLLLLISHIGDRLKFSVIVFFIVFVSRGWRAIYFLVFFVYPIRHHLSLVGALILCEGCGVGLTFYPSGLSNVYLYVRLWGRSHIYS